MILLSAMQEGKFDRNELSATEQKFLRMHHDASVKAKAAVVLGKPSVAKRQDVVNVFMPALSLKGDAAHGKAIYLERCASCHRLGADGFALGPDLVTVQNSGKEKMLVNIIDPNREVPANFQAYQLDRKDGETVVGIIASETANSVILKQAFGKEQSILRREISKMQSQGQSLMPEGLEAGLKTQDIADLLEFVSTAKAGK